MFPAVHVIKDGTVRLTFFAPAAGSLEVLETAESPRAGGAATARVLRPGNGRFTFGRTRLTLASRGVHRLVLRPTHAGAVLRNRHRRLRMLTHIRLYVSYTPVGGRTTTQVKTLVLKTSG
jgi:hypothetical protein